jgi:quercetin dioxygenase-like cupin family protein
MHAVIKAGDMTFSPLRPGVASQGYARVQLMHRPLGSVHIGYDLTRLAPGGRIGDSVAAFETGIFVLDGTVDLLRDGRAVRLSKGDFALIGTGVASAFRNSGADDARWVAMMAPQPKAPGGWQDAFAVAAEDWPARCDAPDFRDPRTWHACETAHFDGRMPPSAHVHGDLTGFAIKMLMDKEFGAVHFNMFIIEFADGGLCNHHDHPFEEAYLILDGKVDITFDGVDYVLEAGDFAWTAVGSRHAFFPKAGQPVRWLEIQAPQPPVREGMRWHARWEHLGQKLKG